MDKMVPVKIKDQGRQPLLSPQKQIIQGPPLPNLLTSHMDMLATDSHEICVHPKQIKNLPSTTSMSSF